MAVAGAAAAAVVSSVAAAEPALAAGALAGSAVLAVAVLRPHVVPALLAVAIVLEHVTVAGVASNRAGAVLAAVALAVHAARGRIRLPRRAAPGLAYLGFACLAALSALWTSSGGGTSYQLTSLAVAVTFGAAFAFLVRTRRDVVLAGAAFVAASAAMAAWWLWSHLHGIDRFENPAGDPNRVAMYLVMAVPVALALAWVPRRAFARVAVVVVGSLVVVGALATLSRGALLALAVAAVATIALPARWLFRSRNHRRRVVLAGAAVLAAAAVVTAPAIAGRFAERPPGTDVVGTRGDLWAAAVQTYGEHPVTGIGYGAFAARSFDLLRRTPGVSLPHHAPEALHEGRVVHNAYLEALVELGPAGAALFAAVLLATAASLVRTARRAPGSVGGRVAAALLVSLAAFAAASMFLSTTTARALAMVVGLATALSSMDRPVPVRGSAHADIRS